MNDTKWWVDFHNFHNLFIQKLRFENEKLEFNILEEIGNLFYVCLFKANSVFNLKNKQFKDDVVNSDDSVDIETLNISN